MELIVELSEKDLRARHEMRQEYVFSIAWKHDNQFYPEPGWMDFGAVILGWWLNALIRLASGSQKEDLLFMDGPFGLSAYRGGDPSQLELSLRGRDAIWRESMATLAHQVFLATDKVCTEFEKLKIGSPQRALLRSGQDELRATGVVS